MSDGILPRLDTGKEWTWLGLRARIVLTWVAVLVLVFLVGSGFMIRSAWEERRILVDRSIAAAVVTANAFEREATGIGYLLKGLSKSPALLSGDLKGSYEQLGATPKPEGAWFAVWDLERQLLNTLRPFGSALPAISDLRTPESREAALNRIRDRGLSVSNRTLDVAGREVVAISLRLDGPDGRMNGFLTTVLPQAHLDAVAREGAFGGGWISFILDRNLAPVAAGDPERRQPPPIPPAVAEQLRTGAGSGSFIGRDETGEILVAYHRLVAPEFTALTTVPMVLVNAPVAEATFRITLAGAGLALLGAVAGLLVRRQVEPVETLKAAVAATETQLRFAEARQASLWNDTFESLFVVKVTPDERFIFEGMNPAHERATGLTSTQIAGKEPSECLPPAVADAVTERYRECLRRGHAILYDEMLDLPNGPRHWQTSLSPVRDPRTGRIVLLVGTARDVTEARQAQNEIERSRRLLQRVVNTSPDVIYLFDVQERRNVFLGGRAEDVLGYGPEEIRAMGSEVLARLVHPGDLPIVVEHTARLRDLPDGEVASAEYRMRDAAGRYRWLRSKETVFSRASDGRVANVIGIATDISNMKAAEAKIVDANERLRSILSSVSDCYLTLDRAFRITDVNDAAERWLGADREQLVGKRLWDLCDRNAQCSRAIRRSMKEPRGTRHQVESGVRPGRWLDLHLYPSAEGLSVFFSDITESRAAQAALDDMSARLLRLQDEERRRIAEELHDSTAQHLVAISLNLMRLQKYVTEDEGHTLLDEAARSGDEAAKELRAFTYLLHPPSLENGGLAGTVREFASGFSRRTGLAMSVSILGDIDGLTFDLQRTLLRVIQEALTNTYRHAAASRVTIGLRLTANVVKLRILDDGCGLARAVRVAAGDGALLGVGIAGMQARLIQFGGSLRLLSGGRGTMVVATVPRISPMDASSQELPKGISGFCPSSSITPLT